MAKSPDVSVRRAKAQTVAPKRRTPKPRVRRKSVMKPVETDRNPDFSAEPTTLSRAVGKYERLAYERHERDCALCAQPDGHPKGYYFDATAGERVVQFIEQFCKHHKGEWAGMPLLLNEWQKFCIRVTYGWKRPDGTRRFRISYREVARKNGKTEQAAGEAAYLLVADGEPGAEVYSTATKEDQAKLVWEATRQMVKQSPALRQYIIPRQKRMLCERIQSIFKPLGADSTTLDGLNPHGHICDEMHAHKKRGVWDVMITGQGARRQPMNIVITTAGIYDPESIGWELHLHAQQVLDGVVEDDTFFAIIFAADEGDDWKAESTWEKANPNLDVSVKRDYLRDQSARADAQPSALNTFLRLHLNQWTAQVTRWIAVDKWDACGAAPLPALATRAGSLAYLGMDLSTKLDITALATLIPTSVRADQPDGTTAIDTTYDAYWTFWCPEELIRERARVGKSPDYAAWVRDGWLHATPGSVIDYGYIKNEIIRQRDLLRIKQLGYDPWNATQLATDLIGHGFSSEPDATRHQLIEMRQGMRTLSEPSKLFETLVISGKIRHGGNPVMRWMVDNAAIRRDANDNIAPDKRSAMGKIDGLVASIMALGRAMLEPVPLQSVYEKRGLRVI